jgi:CubicO group peptidase (beta-lactamase class C family)
MSIMTGTNTLAWRKAQIPGGNGCTHARSLAVFYNALINTNTLLNEEFKPLLWQNVSRSDADRTLGTSLAFSHGFMLSDSRPECRFGRGARAFGHPGAGGSLGFADPDYNISFAYTPCRLGQSVLLDRRAIALIDRLYELLGES